MADDEAISHLSDWLREKFRRYSADTVMVMHSEGVVFMARTGLASFPFQQLVPESAAPDGFRHVIIVKEGEQRRTLLAVEATS